MRRGTAGLLATGIFLGGCSNFRDLFSARADIAAEAGGHQLKAERVAQILGRSGGGPTLQAAEFVSSLWLDYALFAQAFAANTIKRDSATIVRVMWPTISQARVRTWHDTLLARMPPLQTSAADSVYQAGQSRIFQHIIVIPAAATAADTAKVQSAIQGTLAKVKRGADFGKLAAEVSADGSKNDNGYLPPGPRGQFVKEFEDAAWALTPGEVSGIVKTQYGFHLIRRPSLAETRDRLFKWLQDRDAGLKDSLYIRGLAESQGLKVATGAAQAMRAAVSDLEGSRRSSRTLVSLKGGDLTVRDLVRWMGSFPPQVRMQVRNANDSLLTAFVRGLAQSELLLRQADSAGVKLQSGAWQFVQVQYTTAIETLTNELGLSVPELSDSSKLSSDQRTKLANEKVEDYFNRLLEGRAQMREVPAVLASELRAAGKGRVNQAGIARAVELATAQVRRDSAQGGGGSQPRLVQPAPGGPPVQEQPPEQKKKQ